jgi:hypothetical protein
MTCNAKDALKIISLPLVSESFGTKVIEMMIPMKKHDPKKPISDCGLHSKSILFTQLSKYSGSFLSAL